MDFCKKKKVWHVENISNEYLQYSFCDVNCNIKHDGGCNNCGERVLRLETLHKPWHTDRHSSNKHKQKEVNL